MFTLHLIVLIEARTSPALFLVPIYREKNVLIADVGRLSAFDVLKLAAAGREVTHCKNLST